MKINKKEIAGNIILKNNPVMQGYKKTSSNTKDVFY